MKVFVASCACLSLLAGFAWAQQNRLPSEQAKAYAKVCVERAAAVLADPPIKMDVDPDKPCAERGEGGGAMIVPDKKLTEKVLAGAGSDVVPVGQLWFRKWTLAIKGKPVAQDKLRIITVNVDDKDRPMPLFLLGVRKKGEKDLELVVYAKDSEPLLSVPLKKLDQMQDLPVLTGMEPGRQGQRQPDAEHLGQVRGGTENRQNGQIAWGRYRSEQERPQCFLGIVAFSLLVPAA